MEPCDWDRCESSAARASSAASCTAGRAPEELEDSRPMEGSEREDPMTWRERSEKETAREVPLCCLSGVASGDRPPGGEPPTAPARPTAPAEAEVKRPKAARGPAEPRPGAWGGRAEPMV